ncbi:MAG: TAT-variant-translocated molybdopterin oxidoreductase [Fuerstiella sp.]
MKTTINSDSKHYWRSLNDLADRPSFRDWMEREFPSAASELPPGVSRRRWLQLMGASLAFGGMAGCRWEAEQFAPFTVRPQNRMPGEKQSFATCWEINGVARPLAVTSIDGRPIKVEGNSQHPFSRGGTDAFDQAMILSLYDPDRSEGLIQRSGQGVVVRQWEEFDAAFADQLQTQQTSGGRGLAILCSRSSSLTRQQLQQQIAGRFPKSMWCTHEPASHDNTTAGAHMAFGEAVRPRWDLSKARVIACFDADPFGSHPASMQSIREWADRRNPDGDWMNRLYSFESDVSLTGSNADHRAALRSMDIPALIARLEQLVAEGKTVEKNSDSPVERTITALADDLLKNRGQSVLMAGDNQPPEVHARVHRLNVLLGNGGHTVNYVHEPASETAKTTTGLMDLITAMERGQIRMLLILDSNPAYGSSLSQRFAEALPRVDFTMHAGLYRDETAELCDWHVPLAHPLESWSDARTWDGTITLAQPLIAPLFGGRSVPELLSLLTRSGFAEGQSLVRRAFKSWPRGSQRQPPELVPLRTEQEWRQVVHDGFITESDFAMRDVSLQAELDQRLPRGVVGLRWVSRSLDRNAGDHPVRQAPETIVQSGADIQPEVVIRTDASVFDGRFANNAWLQETPDPMTRLTWDNAAVMSPATCRALKVAHGDVVQLSRGDKVISLPVFELPGVAEGSIQLTRGYGRTAAGHVGGLSDEGVAAVGTDITPLLTDTDTVLTDVRIRKTGNIHELATTQDHFAIDAAGLQAIGHRIGELIRTGTITDYEQHPDFVAHQGPHYPPLESPWEERDYEGHAWGMAIDLNRCIGCNACTVACQSENNVPIVGKDQVLAGREMSWLRIDRYFGGDPEEPEFAHQPVACHHCENAPCEQVCPVAATVHSDEGLNDMVYNRCIGTRYCANNCPYKVRRFNFFDYNAPLTEPENILQTMILNPEVTVRSRGVMEKCTYCVQRIQDVKIDAKNNRRRIEDGEIVSACQQACPAQAIVFGDLNDPESAVARSHADQRSYGMLAELNTKPRTRYLARIRNPHPWLAEQQDSHHSHTQTNHQA